jgi:hypothetical protein
LPLTVKIWVVVLATRVVTPLIETGVWGAVGVGELPQPAWSAPIVAIRTMATIAVPPLTR